MKKRKLAAVLDDLSGLFVRSGVSEARLNAEYIVSHACGINRMEFVLKRDEILDGAAIKKIRRMAGFRIRGFPVSYITRRHDFMGTELFINGKVFVPRPETEQMAGLFLKSAEGRRRPRIMDYGTGSGALAVAVAKALKEAEIVAVDKSFFAVKCAKKNAERHGLGSRIKVLKRDCVPLDEGKFDFVVSNPPYVPSKIIRELDPEVRSEPKAALDGGSDGLKIIKSVLKACPLVLKKNGSLFMEIGEDQRERVSNYIVKLNNGLGNAGFHRDYGGKWRFVSVKNNG